MDKKIRYIGKIGQVVLWAIVAVAMLSILILLFAVQKKHIPSPADEFDPQAYIQKCAKDAGREAADIMLPQGGFISPKNFKMYQNIEVEYLCQNIGYFKSCINQHPLLIEEMKMEILNYTRPVIINCLNTLKIELDNRKYNSTMHNPKINISLAPKKIFIIIETGMTLEKNSIVRKFNYIEAQIDYPIYDLAIVANDIASQEANYCYFEYIGYSLLYPEFDIRKFTLSDSTRIYTIKHKSSNKVMNVAIRGCAIPPGI